MRGAPAVLLSLLVVFGIQAPSYTQGAVSSSATLRRQLDEQPLESTAECPIACPEIYSPVCGTDGVQALTFGNKCEFTVANCKRDKKQKLKLLMKKACPDNRVFCNGEAFCRKKERCFTETGGGGGTSGGTGTKPLQFCAELCNSSNCGNTEICVARQAVCLIAPCSVMPSCIPKTSVTN